MSILQLITRALPIATRHASRYKTVYRISRALTKSGRHYSVRYVTNTISNSRIFCNNALISAHLHTNKTTLSNKKITHSPAWRSREVQRCTRILIAALSTLRHCRLVLKTLLHRPAREPVTRRLPILPPSGPPLCNRPAPARLARPDHGDFQPFHFSFTPFYSCDQYKQLVFSDCPIANLQRDSPF